MMPVTEWYRIVDGLPVYNHIEMGHSQGETPTTKHPDQEQYWSKARWAKKLGYLNDAGVLVAVPEEDTHE